MQTSSISVLFRFLVCLGTLLHGLACGEKNGNAGEVALRELAWSFPQTSLGPIAVLVSYPKNLPKSIRLPVLIALHGQGESRKTPAAGARGWLYDYRGRQALERVADPPLTREDFLGMVDENRLSQLNKSLTQRPYRGLIVVCPYLPDSFPHREMKKNAALYGRFITEQLLPRVYRETPAIAKPEATAIDGVSLGGRVALLVGLTHTETFGAVGGVQPAFFKKDVEMLTELVAIARAQNGSLRLRLLSSEKDRFKAFTEQFSQRLHEQKLSHRLDIVRGDHSYKFNRGPGVYELLLYYDRILRGEPYL